LDVTAYMIGIIMRRKSLNIGKILKQDRLIDK